MSWNSVCAPGRLTQKFTVVEPAPLPTSLGSLSTKRLLARACPPSTGGPEVVQLDLAAAPELGPFRGAIAFTVTTGSTVLDGFDYGDPSPVRAAIPRRSR